jgi:hypothetical protein
LHIPGWLQVARRELGLEAAITKLDVESYRRKAALKRKRGSGD